MNKLISAAVVASLYFSASHAHAMDRYAPPPADMDLNLDSVDAWQFRCRQYGECDYVHRHHSLDCYPTASGGMHCDEF
jgi:hypothetical protein